MSASCPDPPFPPPPCVHRSPPRPPLLPPSRHTRLPASPGLKHQAACKCCHQGAQESWPTPPRPPPQGLSPPLSLQEVLQVRTVSRLLKLPHYPQAISRAEPCLSREAATTGLGTQPWPLSGHLQLSQKLLVHTGYAMRRI